jgi:glutamyl-tRNA reductase
VIASCRVASRAPATAARARRGSVGWKRRRRSRRRPPSPAAGLDSMVMGEDPRPAARRLGRGAGTGSGGRAGRRGRHRRAMGVLAAVHLRRGGPGEAVVLNRSGSGPRGWRTGPPHGHPGPPGAAFRAGGRAGRRGRAGRLHRRDRHRRPAGRRSGREMNTRAERGGRPLVVCDLGLPRDVNPGVAELPGVTVVDLARATGAAGDTRAGGGPCLPRLPARPAEVTQMVTALRRRASDVIDAPSCWGSRRGCRTWTPGARGVHSHRPPGCGQAPAHPDGTDQRLAKGPDGANYARALTERTTPGRCASSSSWTHRPRRPSRCRAAGTSSQR